MKKPTIFSIMAMACLVACTSDNLEEPKPEEQVQTPRLLTVEVTENPLLDENGGAKQAKTRADEITTQTLKAFFMNYQANYYTFTKTGSTWSTNSWPTDIASSAKIDFYAYNGGTFNWNNGNPHLDFAVDKSSPASHQTDLLVAKNNVAFNDHSGKVPLTFDHACAAVEFYVCKTSGVADKQVVITSVTLSGVKDQGSYDYSSGWTLGESTASYLLTTGSITLTTEKQRLPCGYLFLIPQTKTGLTLNVNYTVNTGEEQSHDFNLSGIWNAGYEYTVNINMGTSIITE